MRRTPAKLLAVPSVVLVTALLVCRWPEPGGPPPPAEADPEAAAPVPDIVPLRLRAKDALSREVAAGRRSLVEAAALFRELNRLPPEPTKPSRVDPFLTIPADTEEGWLCRQVVEHVRVALHREPERAAAAVARLEAEFFAELQAHGTIRLPDPAALEPVHDLLERARARLAEKQRGGRASRPGGREGRPGVGHPAG
jgi:hypothetical protein